jgi:hypothetical protein
MPTCDSSWLQKLSIPDNFSPSLSIEIVTALAFQIFAHTKPGHEATLCYDVTSIKCVELQKTEGEGGNKANR